MLRSLNKLQGYTIQTKDGEKGVLDTFLFEDMEMIIRYIVIDRGMNVPNDKILISPLAFEEADTSKNKIKLSITKKEMENSLNINSNKPISLQKEDEHVKYLNLPVNRGSIDKKGDNTYNENRNRSIPILKMVEINPNLKAQNEESQLRSTKEVMGYVIRAKDDYIGYINDFIATDRNWIIKYLIAGDDKRLGEKKVLISPSNVNTIVWDKKTIYVDLLSETVLNSPEFDESILSNQINET